MRINTGTPWLTVLGAAMGSCLSIPVYNFYLFGLFIKPLSAEFGWSRGQIALALSFVAYTTMLAAPVVGATIDRAGPKRVIVASIVGLAAAVGSLGSLGPSPTALYAHHVAIALFGLGTLPITYTGVVVAFFERRRGLALGLTLAGVGVGGAVVPGFVQGIIDAHGWRTGYVAIAALMLVVALPAVLLLLREPPRRAANDPVAAGLTFREALRGRVFWLLASILLVLGITSAGVTTHLAALMSDQGLGTAGIAQAFLVLGIALIIGRVGAGILLDHYNPAAIACLVMAAATCGLLMVATCQSTLPVYCGVVLVGFGIGSEFDFLSFFIGRLLGMRAYGVIYGTIYSAFMVGSGLGSPLVGYGFDRFGSYGTPLLLLAAAQGLAAVLFLGLNRPARPVPRPGIA